MIAGRLLGRDGGLDLRGRLGGSELRSGARGRRVGRRGGGGLLSVVGARRGLFSLALGCVGLLLGGDRLVLGGSRLTLRGGDLVPGRVGACPLGLTRGCDSIVLMLLRDPDGGVGEGGSMDRLLDSRVLAPGREILLGARQGGSRLGRIARCVRAGADGLSGVNLGLCGGDGFAGAIGLAGCRRRRRDGHCHGARREQRCDGCEGRSTKHDGLLPLSNAVATGSEVPWRGHATADAQIRFNRRQRICTDQPSRWS